MRSNKELVELLIQEFGMFMNRNMSGLCVYIAALTDLGKINEQENVILTRLIYKYKPEKSVIYFFDIYFFDKYDAAPRIKLLKTILKDLENGK